MLAGLPGSGHAAAPLLARAGIAPEVLGDAAARIPVERYAALYNLLNHELDDEGFGLFSAPMRVGSFEFLCRSAITAPTLAVALERAARFLRIVLPDFTVMLERDQGEARLTISESRALDTGRFRVAAAPAARTQLLAGRPRHRARCGGIPLPAP
jgi:hypothetical protein